ncbi:uncharacterized protein [Amphiura filiformis]|uniref:uncharacterized protein n=1 Tax=Amphiura filiformis TaxID=82378 RepID=UPI003B21FBFA
MECAHHEYNQESQQNSGFLRRNLWFCNEEVKTCTYNMLVRPILEYAGEVWDPHSNIQKQRIEMIQRRAARFCCSDFKRYSSVTTMLARLCWDTLEERRRRNRLTMLYKITKGLVGIEGKHYLMPANDTRTRGSNSLKFQRLYTRLDVHKGSFFVNTVADWNELPDEVVNSPTVEVFKQRLHH